jgi:predicted enzyme related to lactoylglutathione lyase
MNDATKLMEEMMGLCLRYRATMADTTEFSVHMVKAGGMVASAGMMTQLGVPPEHTERLYQAAVDGMAAEAAKIKGEQE